MTVETATYISDLNASYPAATDGKVEGDDHMRLLKTTIKATFPNVTGAVTPTHTELNYVDGVTSAIQTQLDTATNFLQAGTGAVSRTVRAKLRDVVSVKDFGAVGDGTTDDYAAFVLAIAAAAGKKLIVPAGTYKILYTPPSAFSPPANIVIEGDGIGVTTLNFTSSSSAFAVLFTMLNDGFTLSNMSISVTEVATQVYGIVNWSASKLTLERCDFNGGTTATGSSLNSYSYLTISPAAATTQTGLVVDSCVIHGFNHVFLKSNTDVSAQSRLCIRNNNLYGNYASDISLNSPLGSCSQIEIIGNTMHDPIGTSVNPYQFGIALASCTDVVISGNTITGAYGAGSSVLTGAGAIHIEENSKNVSVTGNTIGIDATNVTGISILSNNISGTSYSPSDISIVGNTIRKTGTSMAAGTVGILIPSEFSPATSNISISENTISDFQYGYASTANNPSNVTFKNNVIDTCSYGMRGQEHGMTVVGNTTSNCTVGITATGSGVMVIRDHTFSGCTTNITGAGSRPTMLINPSFIWPAATYSAGTNTYLVMSTAASNDRLHGYISSTAWTPAATADTVVNEYEVTWDGTTFTGTSKMSYAPGGVAVTPARNSSNFVLNLFTASTRANTRVSAKLNGTLAVLV